MYFIATAYKCLQCIGFCTITWILKSCLICSHGAETESEDEHVEDRQVKERMIITKSDSKLSFFSPRYVTK